MEAVNFVTTITSGELCIFFGVIWAGWRIALAIEQTGARAERELDGLNSLLSSVEDSTQNCETSLRNLARAFAPEPDYFEDELDSETLVRPRRPQVFAERP